MRKNSRLPNLQNFGIHFRILLIVNLLAGFAAVLYSYDLGLLFSTFTELSAIVQPILILSLICLYVSTPLLNRLSYWQGLMAIFLLELGITVLSFHLYAQYFSPAVTPSLIRACLLSGMGTALVLYYFNLLQRAYSPAIAEARLQALQARIRPHFLFNSINAVLSLIRSQPKRAESALEDMADLFRVLMADNRDLVPLAQEIALSQQYLALEKIRLEDRLRVHWQVADLPQEAWIPPLIMQPLIENAVYHGIEPLAEGGDITINIEHKNSDLLLSITNTYIAEKDHHQGNKMALKNIRERLLLHYDLEASLKTKSTGNAYSVTIRLPFQNKET